MSEENLPLAADFAPADHARWRSLVDAALKGADFEKRLVSKTYDGLRVEPLYARVPNARPIAGRKAGEPWAVMQRIDHPDPSLSNRQALDDLESGATGLTLVFAGSLNANGYGLPASPEAVARLLDGVFLDGIALDLNLSAATRTAALAIAAYAEQKFDPAKVDFRPSLNPIGGMAATGTSPKPWSELSVTLATTIRDLAARGFRGPFAVADGRIIHNAGGSEAQELAFALAAAVDCLRALETGGTPLDQARGMIYFRLAADDDQFLTIAKFRAMRKLWARVEEACGLPPKPAVVHAETAWRMMTRRDPYTNTLRTTIATAAAAIGGADAIAVIPHTAALGLPDALARRIARNTQLVLQEESRLAAVSDPSAGSGALEALTAKLCDAAWALFQTWDRAGGAWAAVEQELVQKAVGAVRVAREKAVARRRDAITGTSDYPNIHERRTSVLPVTPVTLPQESGAPKIAEPLPNIRLAAPYEALRDRSDLLVQRTGSRPKVFLANLGRISDFTARATFARNFYEAGGIEAVTNDVFTSLEDMVAAFKKSGAKLVCLCSSDKVYETQAADAAKALREGGATVHLAGRPDALEAALKAAGVTTFIYVGCDVLATLSAAHDSLASR